MFQIQRLTLSLTLRCVTNIPVPIDVKREDVSSDNKIVPTLVKREAIWFDELPCTNTIAYSPFYEY